MRENQMSAAAKALDALEAAGKAAKLPWIATDDPSDGCCWDAHVETEAKDRRGMAEDSIADAATRAVADLIALAVNLSAPLAAVARAAMDWRKAAYYVKAERNSASKQGLWQAKSMEAATRSNLFSALDALEAAAAEGGGA